MSESHSTPRAEELGDIFVAVTGDDSVTESQRDEGSKDRELPPGEGVDVEDGLEDAVAGAETGDQSDPAG